MAAEGKEPDILVNLTNDGWFWGSSELDMHLACGVFRAVECRKPFLIAANTGFSAWIDGDGRIRRQGPRRAKDVIVAEPRLDRPPQLVSRPRRLVCRRVSGGVRVVRIGGDLRADAAIGPLPADCAESPRSVLRRQSRTSPTTSWTWQLGKSSEACHRRHHAHFPRFACLLVDMGNWAKLYYKDDVAAFPRVVFDQRTR